MNKKNLVPTYPPGVTLERVQAFISEEDFKYLFRRCFWIRGSQDRVISRLLFLFAELCRKQDISYDEVFDLSKAWDFLNNITLTSHLNGLDAKQFSTTYTFNTDQLRPVGESQ